MNLDYAVDQILQSNEAVLELPTLPINELITSLEEAGYFVTVVDRAPVFNKETLLHALYQSCEMPAYFGFNWDALQDALADFCWKEAKGHVLIFKNFSLLEKRAPEIAETFLEIVEDAAKARGERARGPLRMIQLRS